MPATIRRLAAPLAALALVAGVTSTAAAAAAAPTPIPVQPGEYFVGLVNGASAKAVVRMACPVGAATGHPLSGQTVEADTATPIATAGYTGTLAYSIDVDFVTPSGGVANPPIVLSSFFAPAAIPPTFVLPCSGTGSAVFVPTPTSPSARNYTVQVTFVNITTTP